MENKLLFRPLLPGGTAEPTAASAPGPIAISLSTKRQTCLQCRIRKVRCDGHPTTCGNCQRLDFECSFGQTVVGSAAAISASQERVTGLQLPERRRRTKACVQCRARKTRCLGETPECSNCVRKGLVCTYRTSSAPEKKRKQTADLASSGSPGSSRRSQASLSPDAVAHRDNSTEEAGYRGGELPNPAASASFSPLTATGLDPTTLNELVEDYFEHLYPLPSYAFLHKPTVLERCRDAPLDAPLKLALCAITSLLLQRTSHHYRHDLWAQQAEHLLLSPGALCQPSVFRLQALLLLIRYRIERGAFPTAFMLASLAARAAYALRLNYERADFGVLSSLAQEARRRLFWSLFILDDFFSVGLREFELCPRIRCTFNFPAATRRSWLGGRAGRGRWHIRHVALEDLTAAETARSVRNFEQQLDALRASLRPEEQYSTVNLQKCGRGSRAQFVMVHASWHQCYCDLYRVYLPPGYTEAAPSSAVAGVHPVKRGVMQRSCRGHAESILQIVADFWSLTDQSDTESPPLPLLVERDVAVCAFESARIVLFCCASGSPVVDEALVEAALEKTRLCLEMIKRHFAGSASVKTLRLKLERIINSYSARLVTRQHKEALTEPDPPEPRPTSRLSEFARSRQKLSVQSLLLQSDFVDDSDEIVWSNPGSPLDQIVDTATTVVATAPEPAYITSDLEVPTVTTTVAAKVPPPPLSNFGMDPTDFLPITNSNSFGSSLSQGSGSDITDDGLIFNPWIGLHEIGNIYGGMGMSWSMDQESY
ncbi:hypothetical protein PG991_016017 [Apiospora marii]|uniref:Zn(2)-C6 fungal-type domain-containing protein n=1 Tax=Apiospora marii TaxID=335849 RepID=A0ABR1R0B4_9PEZI